MPKNLVNALLFICGLSVCLLAGGTPWLALVAVALVVHLLWTSRWAAEGKLLASTLIAGSALDSFMLQLGVFDYAEPRQLLPLWQAAMWLLLGTTLNHCLAWSARPWWKASIFGACYGAVVYGLMGLIGNVAYPYGYTKTLLLIAVLWAGVLPALHGFAELYRLQFEQAQRAQRRA
ncbi:DUF2878 domain-containing protein [Ectopseudomonas mendocina]|uniref:DUF2878 domain-containing protein n=1 Tax=Ectopseudomonas mendocina TaxID=300 RepID=A0ABZ2REB2_ECTME